MKTFKGEGSGNRLLASSSHITTKISEGKFLVYGGCGNLYRNQNIMLLIEIEDMDTIFAFHWIEVTGMFELLKRNMCSELYELF